MSPWLGPVKTAFQTEREFLRTFSDTCDGSILAEVPIQNAQLSPWVNFILPWHNLYST